MEEVFTPSAWGLVLVGVLRLEEKVAKAPDPRPNAEEAEVEGEGMEVTRGLTLLKGLKCRLCELESPPRGLFETDCEPKTFCDVDASLDIVRESLLVFERLVHSESICC